MANSNGFVNNIPGIDYANGLPSWEILQEKIDKAAATLKAEAEAHGIFEPHAVVCFVD